MSLHHPYLQTLQATAAFHAGQRPDHPAVLCGDDIVTYAELHRESNRTAHGLRATGLVPGARVAYLGKESQHYYAILFGCAKSKTVLVPINWRLTATEVDYILADSGTALLFVEDEFLDVARQVVAELPEPPVVVCLGAAFTAWKSGHPDTDLGGEGSPDAPLAQIYTSGTTGLPKGGRIRQWKHALRRVR